MKNFSSLKIQAERALSKLTEGKYYNLSDIRERFLKTASTYPQDTVIVAMSSIIDNLHHKKPENLISQGDIEKLYNNLIGLNASGTRFREVCGDLLLSQINVKEVNASVLDSIRDPGEDLLQYDIDKTAVDHLGSMFDEISDKYDPNCIEPAKEKVRLELKSLGFDNSRIKLFGGNSKFFVFSSDLETIQGLTRVYIPVESSGKKFPSIFVAGSKFKPLTPQNVLEYLEGNNNEHTPSAKIILNALNVLIGNVKQSMKKEDFEKISERLPEGNGDLSYQNLFASMTEIPTNTSVSIPNIPLPKELKCLASDFDEGILEASIGYPRESVILAKKMLMTELGCMGFKNAQIKIASKTNDGFICEALINTNTGRTTIEIPIEMKNNYPLYPSVFAQGDYIADFNSHNLHSFAMNKINPSNVLRQYSDLDSMDISQLKDVMVKSALSNDFTSCDEVLDVINEKFDNDIYRNALLDYQDILINMNNTNNYIKAAYDDKDQFVMTPNSIYPIHKKLGRPINDLIRDENGQYHLKSSFASRKLQSTNAAIFNTSKILLGE